MKFYDRIHEISLIRDIRKDARRNARLTVVTGRRRIGKTQLIRNALNDKPYLYFYVARKSEKDLCSGFQAEIQRVLNIPVIGEAHRFETLFAVLMEQAKRETFTLVIDEFQEFFNVNPSIFSVMANIWDNAQKESRMNLIVCGSVNRLMTRIFKDAAEPLYGRNTGKLHVEPFRVSVLKTILADHKPDYSNDDLLALWTMTGGVARYVEQLMDARACDRTSMIETIFRSDSSFLDEGLSVLIQEFGKEYGTYFSILSAIASGHTDYAQIKNDVGTEVGSFLSKLEHDYELIKRKLPIFTPPRAKCANYVIDDCFFRFWFHFVWKYQYLRELGRFDVLRDRVERDFNTFSGYALERYFYWKFLEERKYTRMDAWWDRKGENEIDLVCEDEVSNRIDFYEIKRDRDRIDLNQLKIKSAAFLEKNPGLRNRAQRHLALSLSDM